MLAQHFASELSYATPLLLSLFLPISPYRESWAKKKYGGMDVCKIVVPGYQGGTIPERSEGVLAGLRSERAKRAARASERDSDTTPQPLHPEG